MGFWDIVEVMTKQVVGYGRDIMIGMLYDIVEFIRMSFQNAVNIVRKRCFGMYLGLFLAWDSG